MTEHAKRVSKLIMATIRQQARGLTAGERYDVMDEVVDQAHDMFAEAKTALTPRDIAGIDVGSGESWSGDSQAPLETDSVVDGSTDEAEE